MTTTPTSTSVWPAPDPLKPSRLSSVLFGLVGVGLVVAAVLGFVGLPYVVMEPGPAVNTLGKVAGKDVIQVKNHTTYPTSGALDFTTVRVKGGPGFRVTVYDLLFGWLDPKSDVYDEDLVFPKGVTQTQVDTENAAAMTSSQEVAAAVAERRLGLTVTERVTIADVDPASPNKDVLKPEDTLVTIDGTKATDFTAVTSVIRRHKAGERVPVVVRRAGTEVPVTVTTKESSGRTVIGVHLRVSYDLPVSVTVDAGDVGGPSAGLMFALGIFDTLTPGPLTGGQKVAGTGEMAPDGSVGRIGGIVQKMYGAQAGGADWFLAPAGDCAEAVGREPAGLHVVKVGTYDEAVKAVEAIAAGRGASLPGCSK